jgi:hypothetical protein
VDGQQAGGRGEVSPAGRVEAQPGRQQRGVPVVEVKQVRLEPQRASGAEHRPTEQREPLDIVRLFVDPPAAQVARLFDQVERNPAAQPGLPQPAGQPLAVRPDDLEALRPPREVMGARLDRAVTRHDDPHVQAERPQGRRQAGRHVGQAADLGEGRHLGRDEQHLHRAPPRGPAGGRSATAGLAGRVGLVG